jgi:D-galactose 1-dehydrogenase
MAEYEGIYERFAGLLDRGESTVDVAPFHLVADAMVVGKRETTDAFEW